LEKGKALSKFIFHDRNTEFLAFLFLRLKNTVLNWGLI